MNISHNHSHEVGNYNRPFAIGITLNVIFVVVEASYGVLAESLALIADAGHNLSDVLSLSLAWGASLLASKNATGRRTYGFRRVTILASAISAILLLIALGGIAWEAIGRFADPKPVRSLVVITVAGIGVVINTITALLFKSGQKHDLNIRAAFLHMAADAGISLGVVVAGVAIMIAGWLWLDPVISLVIVVVVLVGTWSLLRDSINLSIDAVPQGIDMDRLTNYLKGIECVCEIHDLHVWALSTTETALTVHLVTTMDLIDNVFQREVQQHLHDNFKIEHSTIQVEKDDSENSCMLNRPECI